MKLGSTGSKIAIGLGALGALSSQINATDYQQYEPSVYDIPVQQVIVDTNDSKHEILEGITFPNVEQPKKEEDCPNCRVVLPPRDTNSSH